MIQKFIVAAILGFLLTASGAMAQEGHWQEIGMQGSGFFTKDSCGSGSLTSAGPSVPANVHQATGAGATTHTAQPSAGIVFRFWRLITRPPTTSAAHDAARIVWG
jgi:hypothetical protein